MKHILILSVIMLPLMVFAQSKHDTKIIVALKDTTNLYETVRQAMGKNDFIIKEDGNKTFVTTHPREFKKIPGFAIAHAELKGNTVEITGHYTLMKNTNIGYTVAPKNYKRILYYKASHGWKLLMQIVEKLDGTVTYAK